MLHLQQVLFRDQLLKSTHFAKPDSARWAKISKGARPLQLDHSIDVVKKIPTSPFTRLQLLLTIGFSKEV